MFIHQSRLRHLLQPTHYFDPAQYRVELRELFAASWQFVTTFSELSQDGDFVTLEIGGIPVLVRNFDGNLRAFQNVCPHRHSMLTCQPRGRMPTLRCQYHGWEFGEDGKTRKIPEARAFRPWDREHSHLKPIRLDRCGDLVFAALSDRAPSLDEWLNPLGEKISEAFATPWWRMADRWEFNCDCNWKVPTENTLESYHVAAVHPSWFGGELPSEQQSDHALTPRYTTLEYQCTTKMDRRGAWACDYLGGQSESLYRHWHVHPNVVFCMTDTFNYLATCQPTGPTTCRIRTRMYTLRGDRRGPFADLVRTVSWRMGRRLMYSIFNEDRGIFDAQQRGLQASDRPGVIGNREERIYQFQQYVCEATGIDSGDPATAEEDAVKTS